MLTGWTLLPKPSIINWRLGWCSSVGDYDPAGAASGSSSGSGSGRLSFFFYQPKIMEVGVGQRRTGFMLSIQSENQLKTHFLLVPSWCVEWLDTSAETFFYTPKFWQNSVEDFDCLVGDSGSSSGRGSGSGSGSGSGRLSFFFYQPKIWEVGVGQRRRGVMLPTQSKNWLKTCF
jgi:hypothetical protein